MAKRGEIRGNVGKWTETASQGRKGPQNGRGRQTGLKTATGVAERGRNGPDRYNRTNPEKGLTGRKGSNDPNRSYVGRPYA